MDLKISIIVPVYNIADYIQTAVDSLLSQTYTNIEIILVDDGSTDRSPQIIDELSNHDERIKVIHKTNGGVTSARMYGVEAAQGEWIGFVDGDDSVEPHMFEHLLKNAVQYDADISHCGYQLVYPSGKIAYYYDSGRLVEQNHEQGTIDLIKGSFVEPGLWNKLFKRKLFAGLADWMDYSIRINEDLLMNYYLFDHAKSSIYEDICPYHYQLRKYSASTGRLNPHKLLDPMRVIKVILKNSNGDVYKVAYAKYIRQLINLSTIYSKENEEWIIPYRKSALKELRSCRKNTPFRKMGIRLCCMALWVSVFPFSYALINSIYGKLKGNDKKYKVD